MATKKTTKTVTPAKRITRLEALRGMLSRTEGASVGDIASAFNVERHTIRSMISTARSKLGWDIVSTSDANRAVTYSLPQPKATSKAKATASAAKPKAKRSTRPSAK